MKYEVFRRDWWLPADASWPNGRKPGPGPRTHMAHVDTEAEAQAMCREYNDSHDAGPMSHKAEYTS